MKRIALLLVLLLPSAALAESGLPDNSTASANAGSILISPAGTRFTLASEDVVVTVHVRDANDDPVANYPFQDVWLDSASGLDNVNICLGGSVADGNSNGEGMTTISGTIYGGGWTQDGLQVYLAGNPAISAPLAIDVNSPDITGDRVVNLSDVAEFGVHFFDQNYDFQIDFDQRGTEDIVDLAILAEHIGERCP